MGSVPDWARWRCLAHSIALSRSQPCPALRRFALSKTSLDASAALSRILVTSIALFRASLAAFWPFSRAELACRFALSIASMIASLAASIASLVASLAFSMGSLIDAEALADLNEAVRLEPQSSAVCNNEAMHTSI